MNGDDRVVLHAYNGTQNLMIQGKNYEHFALDVLEPFFAKKIEDSVADIQNFNTKGKEELGPKRSLRLKSFKSYTCPLCNVKTKTQAQLKVHMKSCHSKPRISSPKRNKIMRVLNEDVSIVIDDIETSIIHSKTDDLKPSNNDKNKSPNIFFPLVEDLVHCNLCDFDTALQEDLNEHLRSIHGQNVLSEIPEKEKSIRALTLKQHLFKCNLCEFGYDDEKEHNLHLQSKHGNLSKPQNSKCVLSEQKLNNDHDIKEHLEATHERASIFLCDKCDLTFESENILKVHIQTTHKSSKVDLAVSDQNAIKCDLCDYRCRYVIQRKKHMDKIHKSEPQYKCKKCNFSTEFVVDVWEHTLVAHPEESDDFKPKDSENFILKIVAEQTNSMMGELASFKMDTRNAFKDIGDSLVTCLDKINKDNNEKCETLGNTVVKIYEKVAQLEKALDVSIRNN